jgi:hypothetical protein
MARYIASIPWANPGTGNVFALSHPGGLMLTPITVRNLWIDGALPRELRARIKRYNAVATSGTSTGTVKGFDDSDALSNAVVRFGSVSYPNAQDLDLTIPTLLSTRGVRESVFAFGTITVSLAHSLVVELLDGDTKAQASPLTFAIVWDE